MKQDIDQIWKILKKHEKKFKDMNFDKTFNSYFKRKFQQLKQKNYYLGVHLAICVDTKDPWKQNRIRFFSPILHVPIDGGAGLTTTTTPESANQPYTSRTDQLEWANPISAMGGIDDSGLSWIPPCGSTVCILFQNGNIKAPFYIGTTWTRERGAENTDGLWNYPMPEFDKIFKGHRKGYLVGKNDGSQVFPPFNTDQYQGFDADSSVDLDLVSDAQSKTTYSHIYGFKTPEKHMFRMDDGDPKCNRRYKRLEIQSSLGHYFLMKDDPFHYCAEWTNPKCTQAFISIIPDVCVASTITFTDLPFSPSIVVVPLPYACAQGPEYCSTIPEEGFSTPLEVEYLGNEFLCPGFVPPVAISTIPVDCLGVMNRIPDFCHNFNNTGKNKYHKHQQECYPFLQGKCALIQSGIQILSRSGHSFVMDDSVEEPRNRPEWERALEPFDYDGCTGNFKGRTYWESATGHFIEMNDEETQPKIRNSRNGINIQSATGNNIYLSDHSMPDCQAGSSRGIHLKSTAEHTLDMVDEGNRQCSGERHGCSKTGAWANKAYVRLRSGYGITVTLSDSNDQKNTDAQYFQIMSPQKDNTQRGPHMLHMQEKAEGAGQIFLRSGGDYIVQTYDSMVEIVGDEKDNPSNKIELISNKKIISVKDVYYNRAKMHVFWSDNYIILGAGKDCAEDGTCIYPVVVATTQIPENISALTGMMASTHVFASSQKTGTPCEGITSD